MVDETIKQYFYNYLSNILNINELDNIIDNSNLFFGVSNTYKNSCFNMFKTKYIRCLNELYIDKISEIDKEIIMDNNTEITKKYELIKNNIKKLITLDNKEFITYNYASNERVVKNPTLVFEINYGRNTKKLENNEYISNLNNQKELLNQIKLKIENTIKNNLGIDCITFIRKAI